MQEKTMSKLFNDFNLLKDINEDLFSLLDDIEHNLNRTSREIDTYNNNAINLSKALKTNKKEFLSVFANGWEDESDLAFYAIQECIARFEKYMSELKKFIAVFELFSIKTNELNFNSDKLKTYLNSIEEKSLAIISKITYFRTEVITALEDIYNSEDDNEVVSDLYNQATKCFKFAYQLKSATV